MIDLLDVNVLLSLAWPNHIHFNAARKWFTSKDRTKWATCPLTQSAFVRLSSNPSVFADNRTPTEAAALLAKMAAQPDHVFISDSVEWSSMKATHLQQVVTHRQVTDAHLLELASRNNARLVTFDAGAAALVPQAQRPQTVKLLKM